MRISSYVLKNKQVNFWLPMTGISYLYNLPCVCVCVYSGLAPYPGYLPCLVPWDTENPDMKKFDSWHHETGPFYHFYL